MDPKIDFRLSQAFYIHPPKESTGCLFTRNKATREYELDHNLQLVPVHKSRPKQRLLSNQRLMEVVYAKLEALGAHPDTAIPDVRKISGDHITGSEAVTAERLIAILDAIESATKSVDIGS